MTECLTEEQIEEYGNRRLAPTDLLAADDHIAVCSHCRSRALKNAGADRTVSSIRQDLVAADPNEMEHPDCEVLAGFVDNTLSEVDREIMEAHLEFCQHCADEVAELRSFRSILATFPTKAYAPAPVTRFNTSGSAGVAGARTTVFRSRSTWAMAATILIAAVVVWQSEHGGHKQLATSHVPAVVSPAQPTTVPGNAGNKDLVNLGGDAVVGGASPMSSGPTPTTAAAITPGSIRPVSKKKAELPASVKAVLASKHLNLATPEIRALTGGKHHKRGLAGSFTLFAPVATAVLTDQPTFTWQNAKVADSYQVLVSTPDGTTVCQSPTLTGTKWTPDKPLPRGSMLSWQVKAITNGSVNETAPMMGARFRIVDEDRAEQIRDAQKTFADQPLALGILYAQASMLDDAEKALAAAAKADPGNDMVPKLLADVKSVRSNM